ncbi:MAG: type I-G CRISPR-associated protein Csb2 [Ramlibacter sp.]
MHVCISVRWLDDRYHGQDRDGGPEWPPSPLRLLQAMVAAAGRTGALPQNVSEALKWLERLCESTPPLIIAPEAMHGRPFLRYVPNNDADNPQKREREKRLSEKLVVPTYLMDGRTIHYVWMLTPSEKENWRRHRPAIIRSSRALATLGWGVDLATGEVRFFDDHQVHSLHGQRWEPTRSNFEYGLRVPICGTLDELTQRHDKVLSQIQPEGRGEEPAPLRQFRRWEYRRASDPVIRPTVCFALLRPGGGYRAFDPARDTMRVAGLVRHAAKRAAESAGGWPDPASFVLGHGEAEGEKHQSVGNRRFAYLPLPSIQPRGAGRAPVVGSIRRICLTVLEPGHEAEIDWASRVLAGQELIREETGEIAALLTPVAEQDKVLRHFLGSASDWASVSPVVLPGYDDPAHYRRRLAKDEVSAQEQRRLLEALHRRIEKLLRKAIRDAGFPEELATHADLDWRDAGFWPGTERAHSYTVPDHLIRFPRLHVRLRWRDAAGQPVRITGPICLGGGRFYGLGLFAAW